MNDHRNHRYRESEPAWPTGDDSDPRAAKPREAAPERTGFWSPLWEEDDEPSGNGRANGNGHSVGAHAARSNGHARSGGDHQWPDAEPPAEPRWPSAAPRPPAPPRPASRSGAPAWPTTDPGGPGAGPGGPGGPGGMPPRRPGGPHTPPPGVPGPNGMPGPNGARPPAGPTTRVVRPRPAGPRHGLAGSEAEGPTELLPPVNRGNGPEPELLTHREPDYDEDRIDDPDLDDDYEDEDGPLSDDDRKRRRKKVWRRVRRTAYVLVALMIIAPIAGFFVAYQMVDVPKPSAVAAKQDQEVTLLKADGTQLSKIVPPEGTRKMVTYEEIPDVVKHAVFAAEDADFETNPGFDIGGMMRAAWNQVSGGDGGASTITQQYIKKATGEDEQTLTRKGLEIVKAYKMNNTYSKNDILTAYLNTIYFGRSANGIAAAATAYYGPETTLDKLTPSQAALLAGMIQNPSRDDEVDYMTRRHKFVMTQMHQRGWITDEDFKGAETLPQLAAKDAARPKAVQGPDAHIQWAVLNEVKREAGLTLEDLKRQGLTVKTTIDGTAQTMMIDSLNEVLNGQPANLRTAMVAIDPKTGAVIAYYGGADGNGLDWAQQRQEPGSSFKPFDLVALLEKGKGLGEQYDGTSGRVIAGAKVRNSSGASCGKDCTVAEAMRRSINTVFYDIAVNEVGTKAVADAAKQAGIKSQLMGPNGAAPDGNIAIGGGQTLVSTYEMASAYATFAANGIKRPPHLVTSIVDADGATVWQPKSGAFDGTKAFDQDTVQNKKIARNVTESLKPVIPYSRLKCEGGRECAGKTGTHQFGATEDNAKAWMVGYTPQISVAVSMAAEENNKQVPLKNAKGDIVYGSGLPGKIWETFMDKYLKGKPKEGFGKYDPIGKEAPKDGEDGNGGKPSGDNGQTNTPTGGKPTGGQTQPTNPTGTTDPTNPTGTTDPTNPSNGGIIPPIGGGGGGGGGRPNG